MFNQKLGFKEGTNSNTLDFSQAEVANRLELVLEAYALSNFPKLAELSVEDREEALRVISAFYMGTILRRAIPPDAELAETRVDGEMAYNLLTTSMVAITAKYGIAPSDIPKELRVV